MIGFDEKIEYDINSTYDNHDIRDRITKIIGAIVGLCMVVFLSAYMYNYYFGDYVAVVMEYSRMWSDKSPDEVTVNKPWWQSGDRVLLTGTWQGKWSGRADALFIVEEVYFNRAKVYFVWNDDQLFNQHRGGNEIIAAFKAKKNQSQIEWYLDTTPHKRGVLQKYTFTLDKASGNLNGTLTDLKTGAVISTVALQKKSK